MPDSLLNLRFEQEHTGTLCVNEEIDKLPLCGLRQVTSCLIVYPSVEDGSIWSGKHQVHSRFSVAE